MLLLLGCDVPIAVPVTICLLLKLQPPPCKCLDFFFFNGKKGEHISISPSTPSRLKFSKMGEEGAFLTFVNNQYLKANQN